MLPDGTNNQQQQQLHGRRQVAAAAAAATGSMHRTNHTKGAIIQPKSQQQQRLNHQGSCNQETKNTMIDQQQQQQTTNNSTTIQLIQSPIAKANSIQQLQLNAMGQFNYNPLYMSSHESTQAHVLGSRDDKTDTGASTDTSSLNQEEEDVLNDIYQYSASSMQQQQQQQDFDNTHQRNQSSASVNSDDNCDRSAINRRPGGRQQQQQQPMDGLRRIKQHQQTPALYSTDEVPLIHQHGHTNAPFSDRISSPLNGSSRQIMRKSNLKGNEIDRTKRVSAMNHSIGGFNSQSQLNFQYQQQQQQQQFMITATGGHQLDPVEECNGGLFVEYQTNRNGPLGGLEELHSLNVTNCDSETLEEHMNMLSGEDCFTTGDDLQDFAIGSTNDHFLNMLTLGNNGESGVATGTNLMGASQNGQSNDGLGTLAGQQLTGGPQHSIEAVQQPTTMRTMIGTKIDAEQQQRHPDLSMDVSCQINMDKKLAGSAGKSFNNKGKEASSKCDETNTKRPRARKRAPLISDSQPMAAFARGNDAATKAAAAVAAALQDKITTTNTNKRLLPNRRGNLKSVDQSSSGKRKGNSSGSWMSSPNSSSASTNSSFSGLSPSSSSQLDSIETPYRQQLENLKKKLKMDAPRLLIAANDQTILDGGLEDQANQASSIQQQTQQQQQQQQQQSYLSMETNPTSANGIVVSSQGGNCILTTTNTSAKQQQPQQPCAYVIARHVEPNQKFDAAPGTIYLRTTSGSLVHLNSDRRSGMPAVVSIGQSDADFSSSASGPPPANSSSSLVISCAGPNGQDPNGVADGQPQQHYMTAASAISARGPTASLVFHPNHQQQQRHADETLIMSTNDLDGIQTLLISSGGPASDDLDNPSLKHHEHHQYHHHHHHDHNHNQHHNHHHHHHHQKLIQANSGDSSSSSSSTSSSLMNQSLFSGPVILQTADQLVGQSAIL